MDHLATQDAAQQIANAPRRHLGTMPGDSLMIPSDVTGYTQIFYDFCEATGLSAEHLTVTRLSTIPIPRFEDRTEIAHMHPTAWANPVFWMPQSWRINDNVTCTDAMALRIVWEMTFSGMYDVIEGFTDVLSLMKLNIDDPEVRQRIQAWAYGTPDELFDSFDITAYLHRPEGHSPDWVAEQVSESAEDMLRASWGLSAVSLRKMVDEAIGEFELTEDESQLRSTLLNQVRLASSLFDGIMYQDAYVSEIMTQLENVLLNPDYTPVAVALELANFLNYVEETNEPAMAHLLDEVDGEDEDFEQPQSTQQPTALPALPDV